MSALQTDNADLPQNHRPFYQLNIRMSPDLPEDLKEKYQCAAAAHNKQVLPTIAGKCNTFDAGFDLFSPGHFVPSGGLVKVDHGIQCSMILVTNTNCPITLSLKLAAGFHVGYYLYPRSSTGTKTPLRLANSVGIIDSGYRGNIIAAFDNKLDVPYNIENGQRLVQLCPPNLTFPVYVVLVDSLDNTERGAGGFGSTGV
jgi:dUTP pyrophosphatase